MAKQATARGPSRRSSSPAAPLQVRARRRRVWKDDRARASPWTTDKAGRIRCSSWAAPRPRRPRLRRGGPGDRPARAGRPCRLRTAWCSPSPARPPAWRSRATSTRGRQRRSPDETGRRHLDDHQEAGRARTSTSSCGRHDVEDGRGNPSPRDPTAARTRSSREVAVRVPSLRAAPRLRVTTYRRGHPPPAPRTHARSPPMKRTDPAAAALRVCCAALLALGLALTARRLGHEGHVPLSARHRGVQGMSCRHVQQLGREAARCSTRTRTECGRLARPPAGSHRVQVRRERDRVADRRGRGRVRERP